MKHLFITITATLTLLFVIPANAAETYDIDTKGAHAFIQFKIKHLGYSWLHGRFNTFDGSFSIDREHPENSSIQVNIDPASIDSNHAERDKHLRGKDFLAVKEYPEAKFVSTSIKKTGKKTAIIEGDFTLHGITKNIKIEARIIGEGNDPWGGYRMGFAGTAVLKLKDFGIDYDLGPASATVEIFLSIEGIRRSDKIQQRKQ